MDEREKKKAARDFEGTVAEGTSRVKDTAARVGDEAVRAGTEILRHNAETVQRTLEYGAKLAARMTEQSANQFEYAFGFSRERGEKATQRPLRNIEIMVQSGTLLTESMQRFFDEWANITRARIGRDFNRMRALSQCRTPWDFAALQSEVLSDNIETFLGFARKIGENSIRVADEAKRRFDSLAEGRESAWTN
jgi:hypothetical protein